MNTTFRLMLATLGAAFAALAACSDDAATANGTPTSQPDGGAPGADSGDQGDGSVNDGSTGNDASAVGLGTGPFTLVYAGTVTGIDMRPIAQGKATFDGSKMTGYEASDDERPQLGTNQVNDATGDSFIALGRWSGGTTAGKFYDSGNAGLIDLPANGGFHYAIGNATDPLPSSGAVTYTELAKTPATVSDGSLTPGTITGSLAASFAGADTKVGFSLTLDVPGDATYTLATTGGAADVSTTEAQFATGGKVKGAFFANVQITSNGGACGGTCSGGVDGIVAGPNGERIALVAHIYKGSGGSPKSVAAALAFKK